MAVPKPPAFDAKTSAEAWTKHVLKDDGTQYAAFSKFPEWKKWADSLRDSVAAQEVQLGDQKKHLDENSRDIRNLQQRVAALEARPPSVPFPGSG
jgi:hypothetical protein